MSLLKNQISCLTERVKLNLLTTGGQTNKKNNVIIYSRFATIQILYLSLQTVQIDKRTYLYSSCTPKNLKIMSPRSIETYIYGRLYKWTNKQDLYIVDSLQKFKYYVWAKSILNNLVYRRYIYKRTDRWNFIYGRFATKIQILCLSKKYIEQLCS